MLHELASIKTADETIWLVHGMMGKRLVCRPKYVNKDNKTFRLHSPLFHCEMRQEFEKYVPYDTSGIYEGLYLIDQENIRDCRTFMEPISTESQTGKQANRVRDIILMETNIQKEKIGFVGSLIWHSEIDGYSDINFAIMGDTAYGKFQAHCEYIREMHFRTELEWREFYYKYNVVGANVEDFIRKSRTVHQQGLIGKIPFTVFHIREELPVYMAMEKDAVFCDCCGEFISDQVTAGYFPILGTLITLQKEYRIILWNRFYSGFFPSHAIIRVRGMLNGNQIIVSPLDKVEIIENL